MPKDLEIIKKYTSEPMYNLMKVINDVGSDSDKKIFNKINSLLFKEKLDLAAKAAMFGSEKTEVNLLRRLFKHAKIAIDNAKDAYYKYIYNRNSRNDLPYLSELKSRTARPITHTIRAKGELPLTSGAMSKGYTLPTGAMSRISGAIALLKGVIQKQDVFMLETIKKKLSTGKVKAALALCREQELLTMNEGRTAEQKAWKRLYNSIKGN